MMRWTLHPLRFFKSAACVASIFTMCISPIAQGKAAQTQGQMINEFMKASGLAKGTTVGEFWQLVRHAYPKPLQGQLDAWVAVNRFEMMPKIEVTPVKDRNGVEQFRLALSSKGEVATVTLTGDDEKPLKINNTTLTMKEVTSYKAYNDLFAKIAAQDPKWKKNLPLKPMYPIGQRPVVTAKEFKAMSPRLQAEYIVSLRKTVEAAQRVYKTMYGAQASTEHDEKYKFALQFIFGESAEAAGSSLAGKPCLYAGYLTKYGENGTCGGPNQGEKDHAAKKSETLASCPGKDQPCHPMVYGYKPDGNNFCVPYGDRRDATQICGDEKHSPLNSPKDKKRIIESYLKKRGKNLNLVLNDKGEIPEDQRKDPILDSYLKDLNSYIEDTVKECDRKPLKTIQEYRPDQKRACDAIRVRAFDLQGFANPTSVDIGTPPPAPITVNACEPGQTVNPTDGTCGACDKDKGYEPSKDPKDGEKCSAIVVAVGVGGDLPGPKEEPKEKEEDKKCKGFICPLPILGVLALIGGTVLLAKVLKKKHKHDDTPQIATPPGATDPGTPVTPPVEPPIVVPNPECLPPRTIVNNQCVLIIDTLPPPTLPSEGDSGLIPAPGMGAGTRNVK